MSLMELYNSTDIKKTRKAHGCFLCGLQIPKGASCHYEKGKWDMDMFSRHSHFECSKKWSEINRDTLKDEEWSELDHMESPSFSEWRAMIIEKYGVSE